MNRFLPHVLAGAMVVGLFGTSGCVARAGYVGPAGPVVSVRTADPMLAVVGPDVWVVQGQSEPVFYADNGYWLYRGGLWYRSHRYNGGWVRSGYVPHTIRTNVRSPYRYRRYRARRGIRTRRAYRVNQRNYRARYRNRVRHNRRVNRHNRRVIRNDNRRIRRDNRRVNRHNRRVIRNDNRRVRRDNRRIRRDNRKVRRDNRKVRRVNKRKARRDKKKKRR